MTTDPSLQGARVFISGGAGFIGSHIAEHALQAGAASVIVLDDFVRGSRENVEHIAKVEVIEGDVCDRALVMDLCRGVDLIFHQAALRITHCAEEPERAVAVMQNGTQNLLEAAREHGVQKVIAASSASVYGEASNLPMDEAHPFNNRTLYGALKIANEQMLRAYNDMFGLRYVALRPFNVYGPRMDTYGAYTEVMIRWLERLSRGETPIIFGDGSQTMDFVHVDDVAAAYVLAAVSDVSDDVFNVGAGVETSLLDALPAPVRSNGSGRLTPEFSRPAALTQSHEGSRL